MWHLFCVACLSVYKGYSQLLQLSLGTFCDHQYEILKTLASVSLDEGDAKSLMLLICIFYDLFEELL